MSVPKSFSTTDFRTHLINSCAFIATLLITNTEEENYTNEAVNKSSAYDTDGHYESKMYAIKIPDRTSDIEKLTCNQNLRVIILMYVFQRKDLKTKAHL